MNLSNTMVSKTEDPTHLKTSLPKQPWFNGTQLYLYKGFWTFECLLKRTKALRNHFQAQDTDILAASFPKSGTTWLKSLVFSISNRHNHSFSDSPLLSHNPHELVPFLEIDIYSNPSSPDLSTRKSPRLFGTHFPFPSLPGSTRDSKCKIIYIFRNPFDTFVSSWLFYRGMDDHTDLLNLDMMDYFFDLFCQGKVPYAPYPDHATGYWKESLERPEKVLFVKYEDLKADPKVELKRMGVFLGCPFSKEEEVGGVIDEIVKLCSIENLKEVATKKKDKVYSMVDNEKFYRKGVVGDWINYLTPSMADKLGKIMEENFQNSGLLD